MAKKKPVTANAETSKRKSLPRSFPQRTLEDSLVIPTLIKEKNGGNPWRTEDVADAACGTTKTANKFFYLAASSRDYGLTNGGRDTEKVELTEFGRKLVYAADATSERELRIESFFKVDIFRRVFEYYGGKTPDETQYVRNALENEFGLKPEFHEEFLATYSANCRFLNIENGLDAAIADRAAPSSSTSSSDVRVVGEPKGKFDRTAFVIMPFVEKGSVSRPAGFFDQALKSLITPAANEAGFSVETALQDGSDLIQSTIVNQLLKADLVIADLSDHNPNVLFELGIRIAKELPVALIRAKGTGPIFDVDHLLRVADYNSNLWPTTIKEDFPKLASHFKAAWDNKDMTRGYMQILTHPQVAAQS